jgi:predicted O-methyltransferase YrrM
MTTLLDTCSLLGTAWGFNGAELYAYAMEDTDTGWDRGAGRYPMGSLWQVEGQLLYALVRMTKPARVLELGTYYGASANHIASALLRNGTGTLDCVDIVTSAGSMIDEVHQSVITLHYTDLVSYLQETDTPYDFIFEDAEHTYALVRAAWENAKLTPHGIMVSHDVLHESVGENVRNGIAAAGFTPFTCLIDPSDCGLALYRHA